MHFALACPCQKEQSQQSSIKFKKIKCHLKHWKDEVEYEEQCLIDQLQNKRSLVSILHAYRFIKTAKII